MSWRYSDLCLYHLVVCGRRLLHRDVIGIKNEGVCQANGRVVIGLNAAEARVSLI